MSRLTRLLALAALCLPALASAYLQFDAEILVQDGDVPIEVIGYSVPDWFDWDGDHVPDLVVGEGGGLDDGKIRVYINQGTLDAPLFDGWFYVQSSMGDLSYPGG